MSAVAASPRSPPPPGQRAELAKALQLALDNVESEAGTRYYILHEDEQDEDVLWMYELYEDQARPRDPHGLTRFGELGPALRPFLGGRPELTFVTPIGGKGL